MSGTGAFRVTYDAGLVEEAVLLAERRLDPAERARFRSERDRLYEVRDYDEREARFEELHGRWFLGLGLDRPLHLCLAERPSLVQRTAGCRVGLARSAKDEMADLDSPGLDSPAHRGPQVTIQVRLRPESLLEPERLACLLRHELQHVADMVDPGFGYRRELPASGAGPSYDNLLRDRYRAVWDATIDGRLYQQGLLGERDREARRAEFESAFPMLDAGAGEQFRRWFDDPHPTHDGIVAFAFAPPAAAGRAAGRCPLCSFPSQRLDPCPERLPAEALDAVRRSHPAWRPSQGLCPQCAELYLARTRAQLDDAAGSPRWL